MKKVLLKNTRSASYLLFFLFQRKLEKLPLPNNRLNDDLSKIHAELFKKENINYNHKNGLNSMTPLDEPKSKSEDGIALLDEQGDKKIFIRKKFVNQSFFFQSEKNPFQILTAYLLSS